MFRLPFGKVQLEEMRRKDLEPLLKEGRKNVEEALKKFSDDEVVSLSPQGFGYLLENGGKIIAENIKIVEGFYSMCKYKGRFFDTTPSREV